MKTFTKHILLLALMLFGVAGAAWALPRAPQKFTGPVDIYDLMDGDTLAPGFSLTYGHGQQEIIRFVAGRYSIDGTPQAYPGGADLTDDPELQSLIFTASNILMYFGEDRTDTIAPMVDMSTPGNAWVVSDFNKGTEGVTMKISGISITPDPTVPALDELTGNWNFLMPGSNKVVKAVLLDSIVVGPHVRVSGLAIEGKYANGTDTVYYYDTTSHSPLILTVTDNDGQGRNFGYWSDLDPNDPEYTDYYRYIGPSGFTCGDTFRAVYPENHTLTLTTNDGGTLELDGVTPATEEQSESFTTNQELSTYTGQNFTITCTNVGDNDGINISHSQPLTITSTNGQNITRVEFHMTYGHQWISTISSTLGTVVGGDGSGDVGNCSITGINATSVSFSSNAYDYVQINQITVYSGGTPATYPYGISKTADNTYLVMEGLTVNVTATPDSAHYLSAIDGHDTVGNHACGYSFVMPSNDYPLLADFQTKPTLTLTQTEGGTLTLEGYSPASLGTGQLSVSVPGNWDDDWAYVSSTDMPTDFQDVDENVARAWQNTTGKAVYLIFAKVGDKVKCYHFYADGTYVETSFTPRKASIYDFVYDDGLALYTTGVIPGVLPAGVVSANATLDTFVVDYGTTLTVTATPDSIHYLATLGGVTMGSNTAKDTTFALTATTNLAANFAPKPTLTLAHNDGGQMEIVPEEVMAVNEFTVPGSWHDDNTLVAATDLPSDFQSVTEAEAKTWQNTTGHPVYLFFKAYSSGTVAYVRFNANGTVADVSTGLKSVIYNNVSDIYEGYLARYTTVGHASNFIASTTEPNTYYIDYGTDVTVVATPDSVHYLVRFDSDADTNSNSAVEKTYTVSGNTTATATFTHKPLLTLNQTEGGELNIGGRSARVSELTSEMKSGWNDDNTLVTPADLPGFQAVDADLAATWTGASPSGYTYLICELTQDDLVRYVVFYDGSYSTDFLSDGRKNGVNMMTMGNHAYYTTGITFPQGILATETPNAYAVDYDSTVVVVAKPDQHYHLTSWSNNYIINATLTDTLRVNNNATLTASFAKNAPELAWTYHGIPVANGTAISAYHGFEADTIDYIDTLVNEEFTYARYKEDASLRYGSTNPAVVSYDENGNYTINGVGTTTIYMVHDGSLMAYDSAYITFTLLAPDTLTLVNNEGGNMTVEIGGGNAVWNSETWADWTDWNVKQHTVEGITIDATGYAGDYNEGGMGKLFLSAFDSGDSIIFSSANGNFTRIEMTFVDDQNKTVNGEGWGAEGNMAVWTGSAREVVIPNCTTLVGQINFFRSGSGNSADSLRVISENTYAAVPGATATVTATPDSVHYLVNFDNDAAINSNDAAEKTYTVNGNTTATATFNAKPTITLAQNEAEWGSVTLQTIEGVRALTDNTYRVDYGTEVSISAYATELHHVAAWTNEDSTAYTDSILYTDYFVTEPVELFPAYSSLTITLTGDTTVRAMFGINSYDVVATTTLDDRVSGEPLLMGTVEATYFDIEGAERSIAPDTNLVLTAQGGSTTTLVAKAEYGYVFKHWTAGNGIYLSDTLRVGEATDAKAVFVPDTFTVTLAANDSLMGSAVIAGMDASTDGTYAIAYLSEMNIMAVPASRCFDFAAWSNIAETTAVSIQTVTLTGDTSITATFVRHDFPGDTTASECDLFAWHDSTYTLTPAEAPAYLYLTSDGCDSTVTLHLTVRHSNTGVETATACDRYEWQGTVYTKSDTLDQRTLTNIEGCDSVVTLNLTVNYHHDTAYNDQADVRYEWLGEVFTENGVYVRTIETYQGCDSTITLTLAIAPYETPIPDIYHLMGAMLMINHFPEGFDSVGYIYYRWYRDGELVKEGLDADSYDEGGVLLDGCYYLEISTDANHKYWAKSNELCFNKGVGIADVETVSLAIAPNPVSKGSRVSVIVSGAADLQGAILTIYDAQGRQVFNSEMRSSKFEIQDSKFSSGIYTVRVALRDGRIATKRLVVR